MGNFTNPLDNISIASPCSQDWNAMMGNERKRYCGECKLNVYNLSGMSRTEAENLILSADGRLCVRFYKRADGTVLTQDCPVGWQAVKRRISRTAAAAFSLIVGLIGGLGFTSALTQTRKTIFLPVITGEMVEEDSGKNVMMGNFSVPTPRTTPKTTPKPRDEEFTVGKMVVPKN
jgi:hypothetical protein